MGNLKKFPIKTTKIANLDIDDKSSDAMNTDVWRALIRPLFLEMYRSGFTEVKIIRTGTKVHLEFAKE